jgi:transcription elongation factor Elf1
MSKYQKIVPHTLENWKCPTCGSKQIQSRTIASAQNLSDGSDHYDVICLNCDGARQLFHYFLEEDRQEPCTEACPFT